MATRVQKALKAFAAVTGLGFVGAAIGVGVIFGKGDDDVNINLAEIGSDLGVEGDVFPVSAEEIEGAANRIDTFDEALFALEHGELASPEQAAAGLATVMIPTAVGAGALAGAATYANTKDDAGSFVNKATGISR